MASIKVKFRPSTIQNHEGSIYFQIIHERKVRHLLTEYKVLTTEWDTARSNVMTTLKSERKSLVLAIRERIRWDLERLTKIARKMEEKGLPFTAEEIIDEFTRYSREFSLFNYMESVIAKLKQKSKVRTSETYRSTLNSFKTFRQNGDIMLDCLSSEIMEDYETWLYRRGVTPNTASFYIRILRAVYNRAVEEEIIENRTPFRKVYTGVDTTVKRALPIDIIRKIKRLELSLSPSLDFARDMFMLSFMLRGMSFIDMAFLKKTDLANGHISYRRRKTGQLLRIEWTKEMQLILDKYPENPTKYLLPILITETVNERSRYRAIGFNINRSLKKIAEKVGITIPLTLYCARHSWASAAKAKGIPLSVISEGMGHDNEATTQIYLSSLDTSAVDQANSIILDSII